MRWSALCVVVLFAGCTVEPEQEEEEEPDYIGPCVAYRENAVVFPGAGCFQVDASRGALGRFGTHPCEADTYCAVIEYDGSGDSGWSWFHDQDDTTQPTVTPAECGTRC